MIPRKQLDIDWKTLAFAALACLRSHDTNSLAAAIDRFFEADGRTLPTLSVRSGFDALLTCLDWPAGSEVLVSAATIQDMPRILIEHGLRPIPVDLDMARLAVDTARLAELITPQTRGILVAHLFGATMDLNPIVEFARSHGLFVIEDCAQAFQGAGYRGHPDSDVRLFSFGLIKTATAVGGGVLIFRDRTLRDSVSRFMSTWPSQSRIDYFRRICRAAALKGASSRWAFTAFAVMCRWCGATHDAVLSRSVRGFAGPDFFRRIRRQPSPALLAVLSRRLSRPVESSLTHRIELAQRILNALPDVSRPGSETITHTHWILPIYHDDADGMITFLWQHGFDATRGASSMTVVPVDNPSLPSPVQAIDSFRRLLYLPFDGSMTDEEIQQLATAIRSYATQPVSPDGPNHPPPES